LQARFYETAGGVQPVWDWLIDLDDADRRTVGKDIAKVEFGWPIGLPSCRPLGKGLYEVRSDLSDGRIGRVLFGTVTAEMVLLHGFVKKTQKTPPADLELARKRLKEVM
jgi:phage-related protein